MYYKRFSLKTTTKYCCIQGTKKLRIHAETTTTYIEHKHKITGASVKTF